MSYKLLYFFEVVRTADMCFILLVKLKKINNNNKIKENQGY